MNKEYNYDIKLLLEKYNQVNEHIRNFRTIHWQIAAVLYLYMVGIIGYGLPNVVGNGKIWIIVSAGLIFVLHFTTYLYFQVIIYLKTEDLIKIEEEIISRSGSSSRTNRCFLTTIEKKRCIFFKKKQTGNGLFCFSVDTRNPFWDWHPEFGFSIILAALLCLAWGLSENPKPQTICAPTKSEIVQNFCSPPNDVNVNLKVSVDGKEVQTQCDKEIIKKNFK